MKLLRLILVVLGGTAAALAALFGFLVFAPFVAVAVYAWPSYPTVFGLATMSAICPKSGATRTSLSISSSRVSDGFLRCEAQSSKTSSKKYRTRHLHVDVVGIARIRRKDPYLRGRRVPPRDLLLARLPSHTFMVWQHRPGHVRQQSLATSIHEQPVDRSSVPAPS